MTLSIIVNSANIVLLLVLIYSLSSLHKFYSKTRDEVNHIYMLLDLFSTMMPSFIKGFYNVLRNKGPVKPEQLNKLKDEWINSSFKDLQSSINRMTSEMTDPILKARLEKMKTCMETAYTLITTLDNNSSPEFIAQISNELQTLFVEMNNLRGDI